MKKEDIMSKKERQANREIAYIFLLMVVCALVMVLFEVCGIILLPKIRTIICLTVIIAISLIPVYMILIMKINETWTKYMVVICTCLISGICFAVFTYQMAMILMFPLLIASVYNNKKLLYIAMSITVGIAFFAHVIAPITMVNVDDPLFTVKKSLLYGFIPRMCFLSAVAVICYFNVCRFNNTINNVLDYGEDLEKSTNGLKRIFIECHEMLQADNSNTFIQSVGGSLFRVIKFLKGNRENVKCLIVLKNEQESFIAMDENYARQDSIIDEDDRFLYIKYNDKEFKIVKNNDQNEGNCVTCGDSILMTFYDKDALVGFIVINATLNMEENANKVTMNVLYNSIKLCISTKQAENLMIESQEQLIYSFSKISESKSKETGQHIRRVSEYMREFGKSICKTNKECDNLACAAMLHDVGKLIVPSEVLDKPGKLNEEEIKIMREHTKYGGKLLEDVPGEMMHMARNIAMQHHERWDGKGYNKLKGEEIDFYSRYVAVIDVFDALISKRCYKAAWPLEAAYEEIINNSGTQFAPEAVNLFKEKYDSLVEIYHKYPDED